MDKLSFSFFHDATTRTVILRAWPGRLKKCDWMSCDNTTQFAGASYSELGDGLGPVVDADAFGFVSTRPYPRRRAVGVLRGAQVFEMSLQVSTNNNKKLGILHLNEASLWNEQWEVQWVDSHPVWSSECESRWGWQSWCSHTSWPGLGQSLLWRCVHRL